MRWIAVLVLAGVAVAGAVLGYARSTGLSALGEPGALEASIATTVRRFAVPPETKGRRSPFPRSSDTVAAGMAHFADHCASCHGNDGSGRTTMGQGLWPKAPDMRGTETQALTDGELFHVIEYGIRFTGMPGWRTGDEAGETATWHLVHFIRELPNLTPDQIERMARMNPRSPEEIRQELEEEAFLRGDDALAAGEPAAP